MPYQIRLLLILMAAPLLALANSDPFAAPSTLPDWQLDNLETKPFQLEILYGDVPHAGDDADQDFQVSKKPSKALLEFGSRLKIAVAQNDGGHLEAVGSYVLDYALSQNDDQTLDLKIYFKSSAPVGVREINAEVTLPPSEWIVMGGLTRTEVKQTTTGEVKERWIYMTAIRITKRNTLATTSHSL